MKFETQKDFPLIPMGEHILKLQSCEEVEFDDRFNKSTTGKVTRIKWRFISNETDDDGVNYDFVVYTGTSYGNEKAALTRLVDMMCPGMTEAKFAEFDSDDFIGRKFSAQIKHVKKDDGNLKADYVFLRPLATKKNVAPKTAAPAEDADMGDPFAEEENYAAAA